MTHHRPIHLMLSVASLVLLAACNDATPSTDDVMATAGTARAPMPSADSIARLATHLAPTVTIHRDQWGVPHVDGRTDASAVFGLAYAQAEDHFWRLEDNFIRALGRRAEVEGESVVGEDKLNRALRIPRLAQDEYARMTPKLRGLLEAYAAGVNHYLSTNPAVRPRLLERVEPWHPLAFIRYNYFQNGFARFAGLRADELQVAALDADALGERGLRSNVGSNGWVINGSRSASGHPLLFINPHLPFGGPGQVYEGHVMSDEGWNFTGYTRLGFPLPYVGHNEHLGWVSTDNYADMSDGYIERFDDPARPLAYRFGTEWREAEEWRDTLRVRAGDSLQLREITLRRTHHGPIVGSKDGKPVAIRMAKLEDDGWLGEWYAMTRSRNLEEFRTALAPLNMLFGNVMYADRDGNTFYLYNGAVPKRDTQFDWRGLVDGSDPATEWRGYHTMNELPQLTNPTTGWMQNCNSTPFMLTSSGNPLAANFPKYMVTEGDIPRARVSRELLQANAKWTLDDLTRAAFDERVFTADSVVPLLLADVERDRNANPRVRAAADTLRRWNRRASTSSVAMTVYARWREIEQGEMRTRADDMPSRVAMLAATLDTLAREHGKWTVAWGETSRHQRPDERRGETFSDARESLPVSGVNGADGGVFTYYARRQPGQVKRYGTSGATYVSVVEFAPKVAGKSIHVYGSSGDPASAHYFDQAKMYVRGEFKPAFLRREDVVANARKSYKPGER
jgi:penicillin amidase